MLWVVLSRKSPSSLHSQVIGNLTLLLVRRAKHLIKPWMQLPGSWASLLPGEVGGWVSVRNLPEKAKPRSVCSLPGSSNSKGHVHEPLLHSPKAPLIAISLCWPLPGHPGRTTCKLQASTAKCIWRCRAYFHVFLKKSLVYSCFLHVIFSFQLVSFTFYSFIVE